MAAHALHDVEHYAFCLEQRTHASFNLESDVAGFHVRPVLDIHCHLKLGVEFLKNFARDIHAGKNAFFLNYETLRSHFIGGNCGKCGMVTVAHILSKRESEKIVNQFVF